MGRRFWQSTGQRPLDPGRHSGRPRPIDGWPLQVVSFSSTSGVNPGRIPVCGILTKRRLRGIGRKGSRPGPVACAKVERSGLEVTCLHAVRIQEGGRAVWDIRWKTRMLAAIGSWHAVTAGAPWFWPALSLGRVRRSGAPARNPRANAGTAVPDACRGLAGSGSNAYGRVVNAESGTAWPAYSGPRRPGIPPHRRSPAIALSESLPADLRRGPLCRDTCRRPLPACA